MKKLNKKLVLARETLKLLNDESSLRVLVGGATVGPACDTEFCNSGSLCHC